MSPPEEIFNISGRLISPSPISGQGYAVFLDKDTLLLNGVEGKYIRFSTDTSNLFYSINVAPGKYYLYAFIDRDSSGVSDGPDNNDYFGIYGSDLDWPSSPNVIIPGSTDTLYDIVMYSYQRFVTKGDYKIAFLSNEAGGDLDIFVMNSDGTNKQQITNLEGDERYIKWSPDGRKIVFSSEQNGNYDIYVMNNDGTDLTQITADAGNDLFPNWSPDGSMLTFTSDRNGNSDIYTINSDGTNEKRLTSNPSSDYLSSWSPKGNKIIFASNRDGTYNYEIYMMNWNGSNQVNLSNHPALDYLGVFSYDGEKIAFISERDHNDVYVMNSDGTQQKRLTNLEGIKSIPSWSPNGEHIVFSSIVYGIPFYAQGNIYTYYFSENKVIELTDNLGVNDQPDVCPDGNRVVFISDRGEGSEIYVIHLDGTDETRLTHNNWLEENPVWSPIRFCFAN